MTDSELIDALGGTGTLARLLKVEPPSVSEWRKNGIPEARRQTLALLYPDIVPSEWLPVKAASS